MSMTDKMEKFNQELSGTRGAGASMLEIDIGARTISDLGVGNMVIRQFDSEARSRQIASINGTLGSAGALGP